MKYDIRYDHITGRRHLSNLSWFELVQTIDNLENDPGVIQGTVFIITMEEKK